ncbi:2-hydroxyacid dehydrogenase [Planotetraspora mira]|uniref:2-hydroxyacid dehydrogenase n=1 Tax=Planotetraspora mira TaxID=58121 RepID=UPI0019524D92
MSGLNVLVAGDHFIRPRAVSGALREALGDHIAVTELVGPWPIEPFGTVAEVSEASGDEDELISNLPGVEIAITQMAPFTARVLAGAPDLRLLVVTRGGPVNVNLEEAAARGIAVSCTPGRNAPAAAELAVALTLAVLRRLKDVHATMAAGEWRSDLYAYDRCGGELDGTEVGIVGFGAIGRRVAAVFDALGARVLVADPFADSVPEGMTLVGPAELLDRSQVVSLHARLTPETHGMIGGAELARMPEGAVLVNTARGALVDTDALTSALKSGHLGGAGLDVYDPEPLPADHPLRALPNVLLVPHLAGATRQTADRAIRMAVEEVARWTAGEPLAYGVSGPRRRSR